ncbi:hypothetical protein FACS189467_7050 [Bacteroidia bacterium]|nr:hypothetical protein FACS189467_7050 [Bacteroidia bacterium]
MLCVKPMFLTSKNMLVPCNKCIACQINRQSDWSIRLIHESADHDSKIFVTLTYNDENVKPLDKRDVQLFIKRLRHRCGSRRIRYFIAGEYGERTYRPHYHAIFFGLPSDLCQQDIQDLWKKGFVSFAPFSEARARYVTKYCIKVGSAYDEKGLQRPFALFSRGLGKSYVLKYKNDMQISGHVGSIYFNGRWRNAPEYYRKKVFTDVERDYLMKKKMRHHAYELFKHDTMVDLSPVIHLLQDYGDDPDYLPWKWPLNPLNKYFTKEVCEERLRRKIRNYVDEYNCASAAEGNKLYKYIWTKMNKRIDRRTI